MINLAGVTSCDERIRGELTQAGIPIRSFDQPRRSEVPATLYGELDGFVFTRAWYYWVVEGRFTPLATAEELYRTARTTIRVVGHAGSPPPSEWADPYGDEPYLCDDETGNCRPNPEAPRGIRCYHIDSQAGLNLFVRTLRTHGVVSA
jgi:hypothetical protein